MKNKNSKSYSLLIFISMTISISMIIYFSFIDIRKLVTLVPDDASYYLKIAQNFNLGTGFSFDGISHTNGFQPLWQYVLIIFTLILNATPENTLRYVMILQVIILQLSAVFFIRLLKVCFKSEVILTGGLLYLIFVYFQYLNGMETPLLILIFVFLIYYTVISNILNEYNPLKEFIAGLITGLLILSRLDSIFFGFVILTVCIYKIFSEKSKNSLIRLTLILLGISIVVLPYLIFNLFYFGNIIPVSGYLKSTLPEFSLNDNLSQLIKYREFFFAAVSVIYLCFYLFSFRKIKDGSLQSLTAIAAIAAAGNTLLLIYIIFFMKWVIFPWYFSAFSISIILIYCITYDSLFKENYKKPVRYILGYLSVLIIIFWGSKVYIKYQDINSEFTDNWNAQSYAASQWAIANTGKSDLFAMKDAGHFSFFSNRDVINLDGLVNSYDFQDVLNEKLLNNYLTNNSVKYFVQHALWNNDEVTEGKYDTLRLNFISHRYSTVSDDIILFKSNEVYRSDNYYDGPYKTVFLIWRY